MCCFEDHPTPWLTIKNQDCFIPIPSQVLYIQPGLPKRSVWEAQSHATAATRTHCASAALIAFAATVFVATRSWAINCQGVLVAGAKLRSIGTTRKYCRKKTISYDFCVFICRQRVTHLVELTKSTTGTDGRSWNTNFISCLFLFRVGEGPFISRNYS